MYHIEMCSDYKIETISNKQVYLFGTHNMAFPAWGTIASKANHSYTLITFDHHTDTWPPFTTLKSKDEYNS